MGQLLTAARTKRPCYPAVVRRQVSSRVMVRWRTVRRVGPLGAFPSARVAAAGCCGPVTSSRGRRPHTIAGQQHPYPRCGVRPVSRLRRRVPSALADTTTPHRCRLISPRWRELHDSTPRITRFFHSTEASRRRYLDWLLLLLLVLFLHAPLGVCSTIRRYQPSQRTVLGQVDCFVQCEVVGSRIALDRVQPRDTRTPWPGGLFQLSGGGAVRVMVITAWCIKQHRIHAVR